MEELASYIPITGRVYRKSNELWSEGVRDRGHEYPLGPTLMHV